ncbi:hypothetical protein LOD99_7511 [Oopsacas minuta]|uniref:Uncharacterized protein n=1 Tax=Oopsacas minuta TaxID=111878 RepID=A0AAV7JUL9_9METZ|nr:hypothetical protein LOD99_7511 [Oopsacas minuta]
MYRITSYRAYAATRTSKDLRFKGRKTLEEIYHDFMALHQEVMKSKGEDTYIPCENRRKRDSRELVALTIIKSAFIAFFSELKRREKVGWDPLSSEDFFPSSRSLDFTQIGFSPYIVIDY